MSWSRLCIQIEIKVDSIECEIKEGDKKMWYNIYPSTRKRRLLFNATLIKWAFIIAQNSFVLKWLCLLGVSKFSKCLPSAFNKYYIKVSLPHVPYTHRSLTC